MYFVIKVVGHLAGDGVHKLVVVAVLGGVGGQPAQRFVPFPVGVQGGHQQINARIAYNEIDLVLLFTDPNTNDPWEDSQMIETIRHCDRNNVPIATNLGTAEIAIMGLQRGNLDWREMVHTKRR